MQRPIGVTITAILMVINIFVDVALSLVSPSIVSPNGHTAEPGLSSVVIAVHIALIGFVVMQCVVVLYFWLGRSWARWFVLFGCIFYLTGLRDLPRQWHHSIPGVILTLGSAALAVYLLWYLHNTDVRDWFARSRSVEPTNK